MFVAKALACVTLKYPDCTQTPRTSLGALMHGCSITRAKKSQVVVSWKASTPHTDSKICAAKLGGFVFQLWDSQDYKDNKKSNLHRGAALLLRQAIVVGAAVNGLR